jgi:hypothetical protein
MSTMRAGLVLMALVSLVIGGCGTARAAPILWRRVVLVELFTSQGCSSCPAADAFVRELPALGFGRDKVAPLTFHVDYWDGLGWKDRFARPEFTARQEWYARSTTLRSPDGEVGLHGLYTPQMIIDGGVHLSGRRREAAIHEMERAAKSPPLFDLKPGAVIRGATLEVTVELGERPSTTGTSDWRLRVALTAREAYTSVARGENAGQTLAEAAVVRALSDPVAIPSSPGAKARVRLTKPDDIAWSDLGVVVFAQAETGAVGAALQMPASAFRQNDRETLTPAAGPGPPSSAPSR